MTRRIGTSIVGAVVLFLWGFVGHVVIGLYDPVYRGFPDESRLLTVLESEAPAGGLYYVPLEPDRDGSSEAEAFIRYVPSGERSTFGAMVGRGLALNAITTFLVLTMLSGIRGGGYWPQVGRFTLVGFVIAFAAHGYYWNWFDFPGPYFALSLLDSVVGWSLVGLIAVPLIRPVDPPSRV